LGGALVKVLVTGGAGYIGSHTCKALAAAGYEPVTYDNLSRGHRWAVKWGPLEEGDILDAERLRAVLLRHKPAALLHFAAYAYVRESVRQPLMYYRNNTTGTTNLLQTLIDIGPVPVVFSSSCAAYGLPLEIPIRESHPQNPINPYGIGKLAVERLLMDLDVTQGLRSISLRYFNAAGADPDKEIGEAHDPETHLIPLALTAARDKSVVQIFGDDYDTPDGTCVRDFIHVSDLADAHVRALGHLLRGGKSERLNLANARGASVKDVVETAARVCGRPIRTEFKPRQAGEPPVLIGDASRAAELLGWQPKRPALETQIADAWAWLCR
jgi:UDP-glucose-4-epimerase GalE